jgi:uncharacterized membrane protein YfcA
VIIALKSYAGFYKYVDVLDEQGLILDWHAIGIITGVGILGSFAGNLISDKLPQQRLKRFFGFFLIAMAVFILYKTFSPFL